MKWFHRLGLPRKRVGVGRDQRPRRNDAVWHMDHGSLILTHQGLRFFWDMPPGFRMPSEALLNCAEHLLLGRHGVAIQQRGRRRVRGDGVAVAYSGGVDSTAALKLLPGAIPIYSDVAFPTGMLKKENALLALADVNGLAIRTNADEIPLLYGKARGSYGAGAFTATSVLLADHLNLGVVADGNVLETIYLSSRYGHGTKYNPQRLETVMERFDRAGLDYCIPCAGLTEVSTTHLASDARYAMGCMRGVGGEPCNNCMKCYRKRALRGDPVPPNRESEARLAKPVIPMLPSLLWAVRYKGLRHPRLDDVDKSIEWVDKWYPDSIKYVPVHLRDRFREVLEQYGIAELADDSPIKTWFSDVDLHVDA